MWARPAAPMASHSLSCSRHQRTLSSASEKSSFVGMKCTQGSMPTSACVSYAEGGARTVELEIWTQLRLPGYDAPSIERMSLYLDCSAGLNDAGRFPWHIDILGYRHSCRASLRTSSNTRLRSCEVFPERWGKKRPIPSSASCCLDLPKYLSWSVNAKSNSGEECRRLHATSRLAWLRGRSERPRMSREEQAPSSAQHVLSLPLQTAMLRFACHGVSSK